MSLEPLLAEIVRQHAAGPVTFAITEYVLVAPIVGVAVRWADVHLPGRNGIFTATSLEGLSRVRSPREVIVVDWPVTRLRELSGVLHDLGKRGVAIHMGDSFGK